MTAPQFASQPDRDRRAPILALLVALAIGAFAVFWGLRFAGAGRDDTFIVLWTGKTLGSAPWFTNYNGEAQDMISTVLGGVVAGVVHALAPGATYLINKVVGLVAAMGCLALIWVSRRSLFPHLPADSLAVVTVLLTAASPCFAYWSVGGLETPYQSLAFVAVAAGLARYRARPGSRSAWLLAAGLVLAVLARTEGFWLVGAAAAYLWVACGGREIRRTDWLAVALPGAVAVAILLARWATTGAPLPNPTYAKVGSLADNWRSGLDYLLEYNRLGPIARTHAAVILASSVVTLLAGASVVTRRVLSPGRLERGADVAMDWVAACGLITGQMLFVASVGGNWMEYYRFVVPVIPLLNIVLVRGLANLSFATGWGGAGRAHAMAAVIAVSLLVGAAIQLVADSGWGDRRARPHAPLPLGLVTGDLTRLDERIRLSNTFYARDHHAILPFIEGPMACYADRLGQLRIATFQAGYFPYAVRSYFGVERVRFIGTLGLIDREVAQLDVPKNSLGLVDGIRIDEILAGHVGSLSRVVLSQDPNMAYLHNAPVSVRQRFSELGYRVVWDRLGALVFLRDGRSAGSSDDPCAASTVERLRCLRDPGGCP